MFRFRYVLCLNFCPKSCKQVKEYKSLREVNANKYNNNKKQKQQQQQQEQQSSKAIRKETNNKTNKTTRAHTHTRSLSTFRTLTLLRSLLCALAGVQCVRSRVSVCVCVPPIGLSLTLRSWKHISNMYVSSLRPRSLSLCLSLTALPLLPASAALNDNNNKERTLKSLQSVIAIASICYLLFVI